MRIELARIQRDADVTIGKITANKVEMWACEDAVRPEKIAGRTAIPAGRYEVRITFSPRFKRMLPLLIGVPGFDGVRIHPGNDADDTEGCILPGLDRRPNGVGRSRDAFNILYQMIRAAEERGEPVFLEITEP